MGDPSATVDLGQSFGASTLGMAFVLGAVTAALGTGLMQSVAASMSQRGPESDPDEGEARYMWRTGGVMVHDRYGVPSAYSARSLRVEVRNESLVIRRPFRSGMQLHWRDIERLERIRRSLGAHTTRLHRGVGRSRIDLNLEPEEHVALQRWHGTRGRVERMQLRLAEARELVFEQGDRVLALRTHDESPWTLVRGVTEQVALAKEMTLERHREDRALHHLGGRGHPLVASVQRVNRHWKGRLVALPQVFVLGREVPWPELRRELEGARAYR
jgi:hypothetical protein